MLVLAPFAVLFAGALLNKWLVDRIRVILSARPPVVFRELLDDSWPKKLRAMSSAIYSFVWQRRDEGLDDPELSRLVRYVRRVNWAAIPVAVIYVVCIFIPQGS